MGFGLALNRLMPSYHVVKVGTQRTPEGPRPGFPDVKLRFDFSDDVEPRRYEPKALFRTVKDFEQVDLS
jgi:hypothetical protein